MHIAQQIEYIIAINHFEEAENKGLKMIPGNFETSLWLHKEGINLDLVMETARNFPDPKTFIIAIGPHKGFYVYSSLKKACIKLINETSCFQHAESA